MLLSTSYQAHRTQPSACYRNTASDTGKEKVARFKTRDGDTVEISREGYAALLAAEEAAGDKD